MLNGLNCNFAGCKSENCETGFSCCYGSGTCCPPYQWCLGSGIFTCCCGSEACSWELPDIQSTCPAAGIDNPLCADTTTGKICNWIITVANTVTYIGSCDKLYRGPCVWAEPRLCRDEFHLFQPIVCCCSEDYTGDSIPLGTSEICLAPE